MSRRTAIVLGVIAFLGISVLVARWLTTEGRERSAVLELVRAQARGDVPGVIARLQGCSADPTCRSQVQRAVAQTRRAGEVKLLALQSPTAYALGEATGRTRVAWTVVGNGLPVVQCVTVKRTGNAITGRRIVLLRLSLPIAGTGTC